MAHGSGHKAGSTPPGWYPCKKPGVLQYWDGQRWLPNFKTAGPASPGFSRQLLGGVRQAAQTPNQRLMFILLAGILAVLVVIAIIMMSMKPWQSDAYKQCVAEQTAAAGGKSYVDSTLKSAIEDYCDNNFG